MDIAFTETIVKIEYSESNQDVAIKQPDFDSHSNQVHKVRTIAGYLYIICRKTLHFFIRILGFFFSISPDQLNLNLKAYFWSFLTV